MSRPPEEGGGAGGAGQKASNPLLPTHRTSADIRPTVQRPLPPHQDQDQPPPANIISQPKVLRPAVFSKLENLVREMQDLEHGVPVRSQKLFLTSIPAAFMGYDLIEWLMDRLCIEDSPVEAVHLANLLCQFGYYFPVSEQKNLLVKDDSSLYRFQSPYFWPSQHHTPDNIEYAIYLYKRAQKNKKIHGLEPGLPDYENDALVHLRRILVSKWDFVTMQAEEQLKVAKDRKKGDKIINESQEKAYWRVYRPPPGYNTLVETPPVPLREQRVKARRNNKEMLRGEIQFMSNYLEGSRVKTSQVAENLLEYTDTFTEWDPLLVGCGPSNPWISDDYNYWEQNKPIPDLPTEKRVRKWAISLEDIIMDPFGVQELLAYMKKEYSHENLRFWCAVQELKKGPGSETKIKKKVKEIYEEFLSKGAKAEINIDGKTMEETRIAMKSPTRNTYDKAAEHVYLLLLKKDCYPRFIRSDHYKNLLANAINPGSSRKRIFNVNFPHIRTKKISQNQPAHVPAGGGGHTVPGINPDDFGIYGGEDEEKTPLNATDTPRKVPGTVSKSANETCPWDSPGVTCPATPPATPPTSSTASTAVPSDSKATASDSQARVATTRPLCLTNIPSSDSVTGLHSTSADLGQVQLHLETASGPASDLGNNQRKKSSSAIAEDTEEIIVKKTSKSSTDVPANAAGVVMACANIVTGTEVFLAEAKASCSTEEATADSTNLGAEDARGQGEAGEGEDENGCSWISSQEVCPWEDDSLTPTWL